MSNSASVDRVLAPQSTGTEAVIRIDARRLAACGAELGEGPRWDASRGVLWFVDIVAPAIKCYNPETGFVRSWSAPSKVGWILPTSAGRLAAGLADGIYEFRSNDASFALILPVESDRTGNRINDGTIDGRGQIWFGTMDDSEQEETGAFYRFDGASLVALALPRVVITNGPAVAADGRSLYHVDTLNKVVSVSTIQNDLSIGPTRTFLALDEADGFPDGVTCDADGGLWVGLWGGWSARRYDRFARMTHEVPLPVANVTKIALGGPEGRAAFVTTARKGLTSGELAAQPFAGDLFTFEAPFPAAHMRRS